MNGMCKKRFYINCGKFGANVAVLIEESIQKGNEEKMGGVDKRNKDNFSEKSTEITTSASGFPESWNNLLGI